MSDDAKSPPAPTAPAGPTPEPFQRKQVTWGRMPTTTFHVGPVPVAPNPLDRIPNRAPLKTPLGQAQAGRPQQVQSRRAPLTTRPGAGILSGSLIPQARPAHGPLTAQPAQPAVPPKPAGQTATDVDLTVRPLPGAAPEPAPAPQTATESAPPIVESGPVVKARQAAPAVSPSLARASTRSASRLPAYVGLGAVAVLVIGGGLWFALRSEPAAPLDAAPAATPVAAAAAPASTPVTPAADAPAPAPTVEAATIEAAPAESAKPRTTTPVAAPRTAAPTTNQAADPPSAPTRTQAPPTTQPALTAVQPQQVVMAPAPTAARPTQAAPDAPVVTRPQPLD